MSDLNDNSRPARVNLSRLPAQRPMVIRGGYVMTMDAAGDLPDHDVVIADGRIVAIGRGAADSGCDVIDARGCIVMPGLIDTHWHMWTSLLRNMSGACGHAYGGLVGGLQPSFAPSDMYVSVTLAAAEALSSGITTVHDWCHNLPSIEFAEEDLRALNEIGIRARFSFGATFGLKGDQPMDLASLRRLAETWSTVSPDGRLRLGLAWRGVLDLYLSDTGEICSRTPDEGVWRTEYDTARGLDLPISVHANLTGADSGHISALSERGLLYSDLQIIHGLSASDADIRAMAAAGSSLSVAPVAAMRTGLGLPRILDFDRAGVKIGLSIDSTPFAGNADMFALMKLARLVENAVNHSEFAIAPRRLLEMATLEGAKTLGLDDEVGSLVPGKRADVIMVDTRHVNMAPFTYPDHMLVEAAQPANVDTVIVDGRVLKRGGRLTVVDTGELAEEANKANLAVRSRGGWS
jgi:cytosine/adenosine deaminase-related metal-dependent hydrolase